MIKKLWKIFYSLKKKGITSEQEKLIRKEMDLILNPTIPEKVIFSEMYARNDFQLFFGKSPSDIPKTMFLQTLEELLARDEQREKDGFRKRIRIGKLMKPGNGKNGKIIVVPSTYEPKFFHDPNTGQEEESTGGTGKGQEGEIIGEQPADPQQGEGEGQGAGQGGGGNHDVGSEAYDLGKVLTEKFSLPNLKDKGKKRSFTKYTYDLTDRNRGFGQVLDKKATMRRIIQTNILLGRVSPENNVPLDNLMMGPQDHVYRIMSREKDFENQAMVFFLRDYSGSMQGKPTEVITSQHLMVYSWLMYQYKNNVETRFIVHDTEAKEVPDFHAYYTYQVAGGTKVAPAFEMVNKIVEEEQLEKEYNIYIFYGTDGDDWDENGDDLVSALEKSLGYANRIGITVAKNAWTNDTKVTNVERTLHGSSFLKQKSGLIRMDVLQAETATEDRIIQGIKRLIS